MYVYITYIYISIYQSERSYLSFWYVWGGNISNSPAKISADPQDSHLYQLSLLLQWSEPAGRRSCFFSPRVRRRNHRDFKHNMGTWLIYRVYKYIYIYMYIYMYMYMFMYICICILRIAVE